MEKETIVIPKEKAVFRMDGQGTWRNEHGPFEHPKIIQYFNRSIQKDDQGYFLCQEMEHTFEKVYFPFEETALFVTGFQTDDVITLALNTGEQIPLDPATLFIKDDSLFVRTPEHLIKFSPKALMALSKKMEETEDGLVLRLPAGEVIIPEHQD